METKTILATKEDIGNTKAAMKSYTTSLIGWMFFFWVLNLITTFVFFMVIS
jgi:hypothetical protein